MRYKRILFSHHRTVGMGEGTLGSVDSKNQSTKVRTCQLSSGHRADRPILSLALGYSQKGDFERGVLEVESLGNWASLVVALGRGATCPCREGRMKDSAEAAWLKLG